MSLIPSIALTFIWLAGAWQASEAASQPADLRVMTFNIRYGSAADGDNHWDKRRELVFDVLRNHRPDVVGLQEALRFQLDEIRAALPGYGEVGVGRDDGKAAGEYAAILYRTDRFEIVEQGTFWLSETPGVPGSISWGAACTRICTWAAMKDKTSGRSFRVYNVHLDHVSQRARENGVNQVLDHLRAIPAGTPSIFLGDFNAGEDNAAVKLVVNAGWIDSYRVLHPQATSVGTYHAWTGSVEQHKIDHIFASPGFKVFEVGIVHDRRGRRYPSDHFPVTARLRLSAN